MADQRYLSAEHHSRLKARDRLAITERQLDVIHRRLGSELARRRRVACAWALRVTEVPPIDLDQGSAHLPVLRSWMLDLNRSALRAHRARDVQAHKRVTSLRDAIEWVVVTYQVQQPIG